MIALFYDSHYELSLEFKSQDNIARVTKQKQWSKATLGCSADIFEYSLSISTQHTAFQVIKSN